MANVQNIAKQFLKAIGSKETAQEAEWIARAATDFAGENYDNVLKAAKTSGKGKMPGGLSTSEYMHTFEKYINDYSEYQAKQGITMFGPEQFVGLGQSLHPVPPKPSGAVYSKKGEDISDNVVRTRQKTVSEANAKADKNLREARNAEKVQAGIDSYGTGGMQFPSVSDVQASNAAMSAGKASSIKAANEKELDKVIRMGGYFPTYGKDGFINGIESPKGIKGHWKLHNDKMVIRNEKQAKAAAEQRNTIFQGFYDQVYGTSESQIASDISKTGALDNSGFEIPTWGKVAIGVGAGWGISTLLDNDGY